MSLNSKQDPTAGPRPVYMRQLLGHVRRSLAVGQRIRVFLVRMQLGPVEQAAPFWERMAKPA
jgi:hypothetical protein